MSMYRNLFNASIDDFTFLWDTETAELGQKNVLHEYIGSDERFIEQLGKKPPIFTIGAILHGQNVQNQRIAFEALLDKPGIKTLIHPLYGTIKVKVLDFTVSSNQKNIGEVRFSIRLGSTLSTPPKKIEITENRIFEIAKGARDAVDNSLLEQWIDPVGSLEQKSLGDELLFLLNFINGRIRDTIGAVSQVSANFNKIVRIFSGQVFDIIDNITDIKNALREVIDTALATVDLPQDLADAWRDMLAVPVFPPEIPVSQIDRQIAQNNTSLNEYLRLQAFINSYEAAVFTDYPTEVEFEENRTFLEGKYAEFFEDIEYQFNQYGLITLITDNNLLNSINYLRFSSFFLLDQKVNNLYKIVDFTTNKTSLSLFIYRMYGNLDLLDQIIELNPDINHANFEGDVKLLSL